MSITIITIKDLGGSFANTYYRTILQKLLHSFYHASSFLLRNTKPAPSTHFASSMHNYQVTFSFLKVYINHLLFCLSHLTISLNPHSLLLILELAQVSSKYAMANTKKSLSFHSFPCIKIMNNLSNCISIEIIYGHTLSTFRIMF